MLIEAAEAGNENEVKEGAVLFTKHASKLGEVENPLKCIQNLFSSVQMIMMLFPTIFPGNKYTSKLRKNTFVNPIKPGGGAASVDFYQVHSQR